MCRKMVLSILVVGALASTPQIVRAQFITAVAQRNADADAPELPQIAPNPLGEDQLCFVDRTHQYNNIPTYLIGAQYVMTTNDNKNVSARRDAP